MTILVALLSINMELGQRFRIVKTTQKIINVNVCNVGAEVIKESLVLATALIPIRLNL